MKRRIFMMILALVLVMGGMPGAVATEVTEETTEPTEQTRPIRGEFECGDDLTWSYAEGVLTITGTGEMDDYEGDAPWAAYREEIREVVLEGVTYIGARAFRDYDALETVDFGSKLKAIGEEVFQFCDGLTVIELPSTFKTFGPLSLSSCKNLTEIHSQGGFPSFKLNCLWETYATIYYPADRPWPVSLIEELENAFHGRVEFLASDGTDHYIPVVETTVPGTEMTSAPTTEAPGEETTAPTEMITEATETVAETTAPQATQAQETEAAEQTTVPAPTQLPTEETQEPNAEEQGVRVLMVGFGVAVILTLVVALVMVLRQVKKKGKYAR